MGIAERRRVARIGPAVHQKNGPDKHLRTRVLNNGDIDLIPDPMEKPMGANSVTGILQTDVNECQGVRERVRRATPICPPSVFFCIL